jgi:hypothetical protein
MEKRAKKQKGISYSLAAATLFEIQSPLSKDASRLN